MDLKYFLDVLWWAIALALLMVASFAMGHYANIMVNPEAFCVKYEARIFENYFEKLTGQSPFGDKSRKEKKGAKK